MKPLRKRAVPAWLLAGKGRKPAALKGASSVIAFLTLLLLPGLADALPSFSRQVGRNCTYCHNAFPKLNDTGRTFLFNGYRFEAEGEWKEVKDLSSVPVSFEVEVEGIYDRITTGGGVAESSDMKVEEAEAVFGGAFGKTGKVTAMAAVAVEQANDGSFEAGIPMAFVQINDVIGRQGAGAMNLKAGTGEIGLLMLSPRGTPISNRYLADRVLKAVGSGERFAEANGSVTSEGQRTVAHRYRAGISREDMSGGNKLRGLYAAWSATLDETLSVGAIARAGKESDGASDIGYRKIGVAAEAEKGPFIFTLGYFLSDRARAADGRDWLAEVIYFMDRFTLGARYEAARFEGGKAARSQTYMARYNILSNAIAQFEYRRLDDEDGIAGAGGGEAEDKLRLILTAVF